MWAAAGLRPHLHRDFGWIKYGELGALVDRVGMGLRGLGLAPGSFIGIVGYNDLEWALCDFAVAVAGFVSVRGVGAGGGGPRLGA